ncbi:hypothetical protein [Vibrio cholerae]|uniref:hypothetical protein n=1 Tax=Vibrio cholerae TaxID=666 RepID=UPI003018ED7E
MSDNDYYKRTKEFDPRTRANGLDLEFELDAISAAFDKIPAPREDGQGYDGPIHVGAATAPTHAVQLQQMEAKLGDNTENANRAEEAAERAEEARDIAIEKARQSGEARDEALEAAATVTNIHREQLEKALGVNARVYPRLTNQNLKVGDVIPAPEDTADGLPITHVIVDGNVYAISPLVSGFVSNLSEIGATIGGVVVSFSRGDISYSSLAFAVGCASVLPIGTEISTRGRFEEGDGGGANYVVSDSSGLTIDGVINHDVGDGKYLKYNYEKLHALALGFKRGAENLTHNEALIDSAYTAARELGLGAIHFQIGAFHFGDSNHSFVDSGGEQGLVGCGRGITKIYVTPSVDGKNFLEVNENVLNFTAKDFSGYSVGRKGRLVNMQSGRGASVKRIDAYGFQKAFIFQVFQGVIQNLYAEDCALGFQWQGGTSTNGAACYAKSCDFGHAFGGALNFSTTSNPAEITMTTGALLNYCHFTNLACDDIAVGCYVVGRGIQNRISGFGAEEVGKGQVPSSAKVFMFPAITNDSDQSYKYQQDDAYDFTDFRLYRFFAGSKLFDIRRECLQTTIDGIGFNDGTIESVAAVYEFTGVSKDTDDIRLKLKNCSGVTSSVASPSISYDGVYANGYRTKFKRNFDAGKFDGIYSKTINSQIVSVDKSVDLLVQKLATNVSSAYTVEINRLGGDFNKLGEGVNGVLTISSRGNSSGVGFTHFFSGQNEVKLSVSLKTLASGKYVSISVNDPGVTYQFRVSGGSTAYQSDGELIIFVGQDL